MKRPVVLQWIQRIRTREIRNQQTSIELLQQYRQTRDTEAFAELVERFAPMVWNACRRVLSDEHRAEDAFQATFLTLARKASSLRYPDRLSGWLYGVARRISLQMAHQKQNTVGEQIVALPGHSNTPLEQMTAKEWMQIVEAEVARLPEQYRSAVLLCWFQNHSLDDAAKELKISKGKLWGWLKRSREKLQARLAHRQLDLSALFAAGLVPASQVSAQLMQRTVHMVTSGGTIPPPILLLSQVGTGSSFLISKWLALVMVVTTLVGSSWMLLPTGAEEPIAKQNLSVEKSIIASNLDGFPLPNGAIQRFGNRQMRHADSARMVAGSPDGKWLATCSNTTLVIWDTKTLKAKHILRDERKILYWPLMGQGGMHFTPDSKGLLVTTGLEKGTGDAYNKVHEVAYIWDVETGKKKVTFSTKVQMVFSAWFSASGKEVLIYSGSTISYHDAATGQALQQVELKEMLIPPSKQYPNIVSGLEKMFICAKEGFYRVYDCKDGKILFTSSKPYEIHNGTFSPNGKLLIYRKYDNIHHVYDLENAQELGTFEHPEKVNQDCPMQVLKDNRTLIFGSPKGALYRWDLQTNRQLPTLGKHSNWTLTQMAINQDESILYSCGHDQLIQRLDLKTGKQLPLPTGYVRHLAMTLSVDGTHLWLGDYAGQLDRWNTTTGKMEHGCIRPDSSAIAYLAPSPDGKWLACGTTNREVELWDLTSQKQVQTIPFIDPPIPDPNGDPQTLAFSPDSKILFTCSQQTGAQAFAIPSGEKLWTVKQARWLAVDPTGKSVVIASENLDKQETAFQLVEPTTGKQKRFRQVEKELPAAPMAAGAAGPTPQLTGMRLTPDGSDLITIHHDGSIRWWNVETGQVRQQVRVKDKSLYALSVSADGKWLAVGDFWGLIHILEIATAKEVCKLVGHDSSITEMVFSKDGRTIFTNADLAPLQWTLKPSDLPKLDNSMDALWEQLQHPDAAKVYQLQWALIQQPEQAQKLFTSKIKQEDFLADRKQYNRWVTDLASSRFKEREAAQKSILDLAERVPLSWLKESLQASKEEEQKNRLQQVIDQRQKEIPLKRLRIGRAMTILERIASPETKTLLQKWANHPEDNLIRSEAKGVLERLKGR